jgi:hypothetical protein
MSDTESIRGILESAHKVVAELNLEAEYRPIAYSKAVDLLAADARIATTPPASATLAPQLSTSQALLGSPDSASNKLARALGVTAEVLELVYVISNDGVDVVLSRSKLPKEKFPAVRALTILVSAGRQGLGLDDGWTGVDVIRDVCRDFGVLDANNFAAAVSAVGDAFVLKGKGAQRQIKVTRAGFEEAARLITQFVGSAR